MVNSVVNDDNQWIIYLLGGDWNHGFFLWLFPSYWEWNVIIPSDVRIVFKMVKLHHQPTKFGNIFYLLYIPWRIHGAAIYGAPWIPSTKKPLYVSIEKPAPWIRHGIWIPEMPCLHGFLNFQDFPAPMVTSWYIPMDVSGYKWWWIVMNDDEWYL